jgi:hypothetical protein
LTTCWKLLFIYMPMYLDVKQLNDDSVITAYKAAKQTTGQLRERSWQKGHEQTEKTEDYQALRETIDAPRHIIDS